MSELPDDWLWNNVKYPFAIDFRPGGSDEHGLLVPRPEYWPELLQLKEDSDE